MSLPIWMIVAVAENGVIGASGDMPWKLSTDLKRFKSLTMDSPMIMGRKTFDSVGKALPGRPSIVVTRDKTWQADGVIPVHDMDTALDLAGELAVSINAEKICIVGGGEIYRHYMDVATQLHVTTVHATPDGDTKFPDIDSAVWTEISREDVPVGERDSAATTYLIYDRKQ